MEIDLDLTELELIKEAIKGIPLQPDLRGNARPTRFPA